MKKIGVYGLWHLGSVLTASWAKLGNQVVGFDYDSNKIANLNNGIPPIYEPFLESTIKENLTNKMVKYTSDLNDLKECEFIFLAYDTPVLNDDSSDTSILVKSINDMKTVLTDGAIVIISSQSPVGFCSELRTILMNEKSTLELAYSPENLRLGEAIQCYLEPGRIILGTSNEKTEEKCVNLFKDIKGEVLCMSLESAEMVKHGINSFLATSIVFANHIADLCEIKSANIDDVVRGMKSDPRIGGKAYLAPGIGFSGGTLGRDLKVLDKINTEAKEFARLFGTIHKYNNERKLDIVTKIEKYFGDLHEKIIGVCGLTYKPGTSTLRRSLPIEIIDLLIQKGGKVQVFDPKADYDELTDDVKFQIKNSITEVSMGVHFIIILTEWPEFKFFDWSTVSHLMKENIIFDTKNFLNKKELVQAGFKYLSIGR